MYDSKLGLFNIKDIALILGKTWFDRSIKNGISEYLFLDTDTYILRKDSNLTGREHTRLTYLG